MRFAPKVSALSFTVLLGMSGISSITSAAPQTGTKVLGQVSQLEAHSDVTAPMIGKEAVAPSSEDTGLPSSDSEAGDRNKAGWMDSSHRFVSKKSDGLVRWFDGFFGVPRSDLESAQSFLRVRMDNEWDEEDGNSVGFRVRGKVNLPRVSERIGLIFSDERGDETGAGGSVEQALSDNNPRNDVALQYTGIDKERSRLDFKLGFRSGLRVKLAARYRYELPLQNDTLARFSEELYFRDGDGFGTFTRFDLDKTLEQKKLLRWANRFEWGEKTRGVEWGSTLSLARRINDKSALSYFVNVEGDTRPNELNRSYGLGVTYRRNFLRRWLFFELEPAYVWRRNLEDPMPGVIEPYFADREGVARFTARIEVLFGEDQL
ncbi:MAG: hypothetical protein AB8B86_10345 [Pseudomonadales bacterium]